MDLVLCTINVWLVKGFVIPENSIYIPKEITKLPIKNCSVSLVTTIVEGSPVIFIVNGPPYLDKNVIEIMAPFYIREKFDLEDGDEIEVDISRFTL